MSTDLNLDNHSFHVPVMGIGFTIDTPIRLAPLGIDSAISLVNDSVAEAAGIHHSKRKLRPYERIDSKEKHSRSRRFTRYLNLIDALVAEDFERLRESSFSDPQGIKRYFELLPDASPQKKSYLKVQAMKPGAEREKAEEQLRSLPRRGSIGANIMTKLDGAKDERGEAREKHDSDAQAALRGFAESCVEGPMILSAGANPGLFAYLAEFDDFFPDDAGHTKKTLILKVSDFRSAHVQGRMLARRGLWISEYRIESGLNCGGHAFPTEGVLMGPILHEFSERRDELREGLFAAYQKGLKKRGSFVPTDLPRVKITAQGGIGTAAEDEFCREVFSLDGTGWGTPFLMVPEAVLMDPKTMQQMKTAEPKDVQLSWSSPLGVRLWWLSSCESEESRLDRIEAGHPGSVCTARHLALSEEYGKVPLCIGSRAYQNRKKKELDPKHPDYAIQLQRLEAPACICVDLCGSFLACTGDEDAPPTAICPGPNIVNFQEERSLEEMVDHIYGRQNILTRIGRPHMLLREAELYFEIFEADFEVLGTSLQTRTAEELHKAFQTLADGLDSYRELIALLTPPERSSFAKLLSSLRQTADDWISRLTPTQEAQEEPVLSQTA